MTAPQAYSEICTDEKGATAAQFWQRAAAWFDSHGVRCERALTDNTTCSFRSGVLFAGLDISISLQQAQPRPEHET